MQRRSGTDAIARTVALGIAVGGHVLLIALIWNARRIPYHEDDLPDTVAVWLRVDHPILPPSNPVTASEPPAVATPHRAEHAAAIPQQAGTTEAVTAPPQQINWGAQAAYKAKKTVEDSVTDSYRNFGPRKPGAPDEPQPPVLIEEEKSAFGEEGTDVHGDPVVRLSEHCYQELERTVQTVRDYPGLSQAPQVKCFFPIGKPEPRGDLFEHLKRERPLIPPKNGVPDPLPEQTKPDDP
ncbi:MAG TPA: hypothetical protein VIT67_10665 [Povalibacter sp.]